MNRRDALKSLLAAPVAAAVPVEPQKFDVEAFFASPEFRGPHVHEDPDDYASRWRELVVLEYEQPHHQFGRLQIHHVVHGTQRDTTGTIRMPFIGPDGYMWTRELSDSGRRDAKGRRIFA